jgi:hypothetical protein
MRNPFYFKALPDNAPFCNRHKELAALLRFAESLNDVVLYSPRRYGKTSLVRRVQKTLRDQGAVTLFIDFYGVASVHEVASRVAAAVFRVTHGQKPLWDKALQIIKTFRPVLRPSQDGGVEVSVEASEGRLGMSLLEAALDELGEFVARVGRPMHTVFDEFQEITVLPEARQIEAAMRTRIQQFQAAHCFVGSRRRLLLAMFNENQRPFFQSAHNFALPPLPEGELTDFVRDQFIAAGTTCSQSAAADLVRRVKCHPHYTQRLGYLTFEVAEQAVTTSHIDEAFRDLLTTERPVFEAMLQPLPPQQRLLLRALAREPAQQVMAKDFVRTHHLGSTNGIGHSIKQLATLDLVADDDGPWQVVDPLFAVWLQQH